MTIDNHGITLGSILIARPAADGDPFTFLEHAFHSDLYGAPPSRGLNIASIAFTCLLGL